MSEAGASGEGSAGESRQGDPGAEQRPPRHVPPPPFEANDRVVTGVITAGWAIALVVLIIVRDTLPPGSRWWLWTCAAGFGLGLFGLWYVPLLKQGRARAATGHSRGEAAGPQSPESGSAYESRDSASKTVSSTETPGNSTKS
jgi:hypothetical protein